MPFIHPPCRRRTLLIVVILFETLLILILVLLFVILVIVVLIKISRRILVQNPLPPKTTILNTSPTFKTICTDPILIHFIKIQTVPLLPSQTAYTPSPWSFSPQLQQIEIPIFSFPRASTNTFSVLTHTHSTVTTPSLPRPNEMPIIRNIQHLLPPTDF